MVVIRIVDIVVIKRKGRILSLKRNAKFVAHLSMPHNIKLEAMVRSARYFGGFFFNIIIKIVQLLMHIDQWDVWRQNGE